MSEHKIERCSVCWREKDYTQGVRFHPSYCESAWVCSPECAEFVHQDMEYYGEFYNNFYNSMFSAPDFYGEASHFCSYKDWWKNKPKCDKRGVGGFHHGKRHSEDTNVPAQKRWWRPELKVSMTTEERLQEILQRNIITGAFNADGAVEEIMALFGGK